MRISDWSSDVCSSDLRNRPAMANATRREVMPVAVAIPMLPEKVLSPTVPSRPAVRVDRKSGVLGKSVSVRVDLGGRRLIKKKTDNQATHTYSAILLT